MALAVAYQTTVTSITSNAALYTTSTTGYQRDLAITNSGASFLYVVAGTSATTAAAATGFGIPTGQTVILEGQVPNSTIIFGYSAGTAAASIGYASVVSVI